MARFKEIRQTITHEEIEAPKVDLELLEKWSSEIIVYTAMEKDIKEHKPVARQEFFDLLTDKVRAERTIASQTIDLSVDEVGDSIDDVKMVLLRDWPEMEMVNISRDGDSWIVEIQENPSIIKASYVNREHEKVVGRTYAVSGASFDVDQFVKDHEDLAMECVGVSQTFSYSPGNWMGEEDSASVSYIFDEKIATKMMTKDPDLLPIFQQYTRPGKVSVKLTPIRDAKPEELEESV